jgi:hypothetical protein
LAEEFKQHIMRQAPFLFSGNQFRVIELVYTPEHFGNAILVLEDEVMRIQIIKDRSQILIDFQPKTKHKRKFWFSIDVVKQLITGNIEETAEMTPENIEFLRNNLDIIEDHFSPINLEETISRLQDLERERAKRIFPK